MTVCAIGIALVMVLLVGAGAAPTTVERVEGSLALEASLPKRVYAPGEVVEITLIGRNIGQAPLGVIFSSGQRFEFMVRRRRGDEVWRWSHDKAFIQVVQTAVLRPQETLTFRAAWEQRDLQGRRVDPGAYEIIAIFLGRLEDGKSSLALPPLTFTITK